MPIDTSFFAPQIKRTLTVESEAMPSRYGKEVFEPVKLSGHEGVNSLFDYELLLGMTSDIRQFHDVPLYLREFVGREISCRIEIDGLGAAVRDPRVFVRDRLGAGTREINGMVTQAELWGEDGRRIFYKLTLRPWLHLATLSGDCKIFQRKTVTEVFDELLSRYPYPVEKRLGGLDGYGPRYPAREFVTQFNETDFEFFERLTQEWGINYHFEHGEGKHRLVLTDGRTRFKKNPSEAYHEVECHPPGWKVDAEYIHAFNAESKLTTKTYATRDYDYTQPGQRLYSQRSDPRPDSEANGEVYQWHAHRMGTHYAQPKVKGVERGDATHEGNVISDLRLQALRTEGSRAKASGNLRGMTPGHVFQLRAHPQEQLNVEYLVLDTQFLIEDTARASQQSGSHHPTVTGQWRVNVELALHPATETLRPAPTRVRPRTGGPQPALVVGPPGQDIFTDELGRIKVKFFWDRVNEPNENASCWLRVASPWAGNRFGCLHLPRIGHEVVVDFYAGNPDLPFCAASIFNFYNDPPWPLPDQGALSGIQSRELVAGQGNYVGRSNHLLMDDTAGQLQAQLHSDHLSSTLGLGRLTRIDTHKGRKEGRGEGFELRTDGHGVVRAGFGMLLTTQGRPRAESHVTDLGEAADRLAAARDRHLALASAARAVEAQEPTDQEQVATVLARQNAGLRGPLRADDGAVTGSQELIDPHLVLASPAAILASAAGSVHLQSGEHVAVTSDGHASVAAGRSFLASARDAIRFFSYKMGMRLIAYGGDIEIKALKKGLHLVAQLDITQSAETISIKARKSIQLNGGGSCLTLDEAGITGKTLGIHEMRAAAHNWSGPMNAASSPSSAASELADPLGVFSVQLRSHPEGGRAMAMEPYTLLRDGTVVHKGVTDARGRVRIEEHRPGSKAYSIELANGNGFELPMVSDLAAPEHQMAARGYRAAVGVVQTRVQHFQHFRGGADAY